MNDMKLRFELPSKEREKEALEYIEEFRKNNSVVNGSGGLDHAPDYDRWLIRTDNYHNGIIVNPKWVAASTYFVFNENDVLVGMTNIRHTLNDYLIESGSGHIGYSVRPSQRRLGYATEILKQSLEILKKEYNVNRAFVGCYKNNIGSKKTILNNGGVLEKEISIDDEPVTLSFYIDL